MSPDTTEVRRVPSSVHEIIVDIPLRDKLDEIISDSMDVLNKYLKWCADTELAIQMMLYMLHRIRDSMQVYTDHLDNMKNFFAHHEQIQSECYAECCRKLPGYGDYLKALKDSEDVVRVEGIPRGLPQREVRKLVEAVVDNVYDAGNFVVSELSLCRNIENNERRKLLLKYIDPLSERPAIFQVIDDNQRAIKDTLFYLSAFVHFLQIDQSDSVMPDFNVSKSLEEL